MRRMGRGRMRALDNAKIITGREPDPLHLGASRRAGMFVLFCFFFFFAPRQASPNAPATQPVLAEFKIEDSNHAITIPVMWKGKQKCFIFDTGSAFSIM